MTAVVLLGPPGAGKGTVAETLAGNGYAHISTGQLLREQIQLETPVGCEAKQLLDEGRLAPDEVVVGMISDLIARAPENQKFLFDGFPRTLQQAKDLDVMLNKTADCVTLVLALEVNQEEVIQRLLKRAQEQGRKDDTEEVIRNRMAVYHKQTSPLIDFYKTQGKFESIKGVGSIDAIFDNIRQIIDIHHA